MRAIHWHASQAPTLLPVDTVISVQTLKVGGPASAFPVWIGKLVVACNNASNPVPLDFVSSHAYPTTGGARNAEISGLMKQISNANEGAGGANRTLPLLITEWNGVCNSRGTVRVSRQKFTLEDANGSHACSLEVLTCV